MPGRHIYNIPLSCSFWDTLVKIYLERYQNDDMGLADALFLVPNRRSCQMLTAAFVRQQGLKPAILPQIVPISEIDDDELFFSRFNWNTINLDDKSVISTEKRLFIFARLIMSKPNDFGLKQISLAQALSLASELANLIDTAYNMELSFDKLKDLVPDKYATHWQETLKLLGIITEFWPQILAEQNSVDACQLKRELLYQQAEIWQKEHSDKHIIVAGITASFPAIVNLLKVVSALENGEIYFAGLDCYADEAYWEAIDESHPQFELKELLNLLELKREDVIPILKSEKPEREKFISEIMRPATVSNAWLALSKDDYPADMFKNIQFIETPSQREEALTIALKMREILNFEGKTAALVTYDRNLARRVATELERFEIKIDDSAGLPLHLTSVGIFLRLIAEAAENLTSDVKLITLLKHPFMLFGHNPADIRTEIYEYELSLRKPKYQSDFVFSIIPLIKEKIADFAQLIKSPHVDFIELFKSHIKLAEEFAFSADFPKHNQLWRGDAGKSAATFVTKILETGETLGAINGKDYISLFCVLMSMSSVRTNYGTHPRLSILGPIEAKLCHFDYVILGEFNEGIWPKPIQADMWMSRPMKKDFGFSLPEKNIGILAADLSGFLASDNVILTRAERVDGTPMKKSRWLLRLETVLRAIDLELEDIKENAVSSLALRLDKPTEHITLAPPAPCPPASARPKCFSASAVDLLVADPYSVFAKYILKLYPLDDLDRIPDQRDYGTLVHGIVEDFNNKHPDVMPENALDEIISLGEEHFLKSGISKDLKAFWWPKFLNTAIAFIAQDNRTDVLHIDNEVCGEICYSLPEGDFKFTAKADRIDTLKNGFLNILDYKTGKIPTLSQVKSGHALQLLLEGLIAQKGKFEGISSKKLNDLIYWHLGSEITDKNLLILPLEEENLLKTCEEYLLKLMTTFSFETTPYLSRPIPKFISKNRDYEHLARIKEWSVQEEDGGSDE